MTGRRALAIIAAATVSLGFTGCVPQTGPVADERDSAATLATADTPRPNFLLIVADDLGFSDIAPYGGEMPTPNLARLAAEGTRFLDFHTAVKCNPTRAMLHTGIDNNTAAVGPRRNYRLSPDAATLAEVLRDAGYHTYMTGKWDLGRGADQVPSARGFEQVFALLPGAGRHFPNPHRQESDELDSYSDNGERVGVPGDFYSTHHYTDRMLDYIDANLGDGRPFFAFLSYTAPHYPLQAPRERIEAYGGWYEDGYQATRAARIGRLRGLGLFPADFEPYPAPGLTEWSSLTDAERARESRRMQIYAAMVDIMDEQIGRVLAYLDEQGIADDTVVLFMSDNGADGTATGAGYNEADDNRLENLGSATSYVTVGADWARVSSTPLRLYKTFTTEGGTRVPAILRWPGRVAAQRIDRNYFQVADLMPTFLELAGVTHPAATDNAGASDAGAGRAAISSDAHADEPGASLTANSGDATAGQPANAGEPGAGRAGTGILPMQGRSVAALWLHGTPAYGDTDHAFHTYIEPRLGGGYVRRGDWKLAWWKEDGEFTSGALFNLAEDPAETRDLSADHPEITAELTQAWLDYAAENNVDIESTSAADTPPPSP